MNEEIQLAPPGELTIPVRDGVELRLVDPATSPEMFALIQKNLDRFKPYINWADEVYNEEDRFRGFMFQLDQYYAGTAYPMAIWVDSKIVGTVDIRDIGSEDGAEVGYLIDEDYKGQGIVKQSLLTLIDFARSRHQIDRIRLNTMEDNAASRGLAESMGFEVASITPITEGRFVGRNEANYVKVYEQQEAA
jgi:ribosomal-protein-serine acetyltransferase